MPELPELEVVKEVLQRRVVGQPITSIEIRPPGGALVIRDMTGRGFEAALTRQTISGITRRGKFLVLHFDDAQPPLYLAINPKLTGRLQLAEAADKRLPKTQVVFTLGNGKQLRYLDQKVMGQLYLSENLGVLPDYAGLGPEALDISFDEFKSRLKPFRGEIKGVLTICGGHRQCLCRRDPVDCAAFPVPQADPIDRGRDSPPLRRNAGGASQRHRACSHPDGREYPPGAAWLHGGPHEGGRAMPSLRQAHLADRRERAHHQLLPSLPAGRAGARNGAHLTNPLDPRSLAD
jgi:hypothetical protein